MRWVRSFRSGWRLGSFGFSVCVHLLSVLTGVIDDASQRPVHMYTWLAWVGRAGAGAGAGGAAA